MILESSSTKQHLDISCFPLLRIDQIGLHSIDTLMKSQAELTSMVLEHDESEDVKIYASKLRRLISYEIKTRQTSVPVNDFYKYEENCSSIKKHVGGIINYKNNNSFKSSPRRKYYPPTSTSTAGESQQESLSSIHKYVVSSNASGNGGFRVRAKQRNSARKNKKRTNTVEYKKALQDQEKQMRREQAKERMELRRVRRAAIEARLEEKMEKKKIQEAKRLKIQQEMERVMESAMQQKDYLDDEIVHAHAAIAATEVLEAADVSIMNSDSGSSLASDVESLPEIDTTLDGSFSLCNSYTDANEITDLQEEGLDVSENENNFDQVFVEGSGYSEGPDELLKGINISGGDEEEDCKKHSHLQPVKALNPIEKPMLGDRIDISSNYETTARAPKLTISEIDRKQEHENMESQSETLDKTQTTDQLQECEETSVTEEIEWQPWSSMKARKHQSSTLEVYRTDEYPFTTLFPSFNSIFAAFASDGSSHNVSDRNMNIERECLEYQGKVLKNILSIQRSKSKISTDEATKDSLLFSTKSMRQEVTSIISDVLISQQDANWQDITSELSYGNCWNLLWTWKKPKLNPEHLLVWQRISRFPNTSCLTRKDYLKKHLEMRMAKCKRSHNTWNIMPLTYVLPNEFTTFLASFSSIQKRCKGNGANTNLWIMKPVGMSRGRGISLINDIGQVTYSSPTVIQKYLTNPLLLDGYKFDLRIYVLVTSYSPLEAFIYQEGFARFGSRPYTSHSESLNDIQIHLTNSSIQKSYKFDIKASHPVTHAGKDGGGNKVKMTWLWKRLKALGLLNDHDSTWEKIQQLCLKTLIAVKDKIPPQPNAFEIYGFDVMIDDHQKPWLIEVNACPALARENDLDSIVKEALIEDTIKIISPPNYNRQALAEICHRRLWKKKRSTNRSQSISEREVLEQDLRRILNHELPRQYGEEPKCSTNYQRLAPGNLFDQMMNANA